MINPEVSENQPFLEQCKFSLTFFVESSKKRFLQFKKDFGNRFGGRDCLLGINPGDMILEKCFTFKH